MLKINWTIFARFVCTSGKFMEVNLRGFWKLIPLHQPIDEYIRRFTRTWIIWAHADAMGMIRHAPVIGELVVDTHILVVQPSLAKVANRTPVPTPRTVVYGGVQRTSS